MKNYRHQRTFVFSNTMEDVASVAKSCVEYLEESKVLLPVTLHSRVRWALTELLINGVKHAGIAESYLHFRFENDKLIIVKEDFGNPLQLHVNNRSVALTWPVDSPNLFQNFEVYQNGMDSLRILTDTTHSASFALGETDDSDMPQLLLTTSEHFGLMIITKSSDHFTYSFDQLTNKNTFTLTFSFIE